MTSDALQNYDSDKSTEWGREFDTNVPTYTKLVEEIKYTLWEALNEAEIKIHSVEGRVKDRPGFMEKITRKDYSDPFNEMPDIVGARAVCLFIEDLPKIDEIIRENFTVKVTEDKINDSAIDSFGYMSVHYECSWKESNTGPRYRGFEGITFEIQCRTLLMDAWANVSHHLAYKGKASVPNELQKDFHALSALFYIADQQFQKFQDASAKAEMDAPAKIVSSATVDVVIDRSTLKALLIELYPDRERVDDAGYSELVEELAVAGFTEINKLRKLLTKGMHKAERDEAANPPWDSQEGSRTRYSQMGIVRQTLQYPRSY